MATSLVRRFQRPILACALLFFIWSGVRGWLDLRERPNYPNFPLPVAGEKVVVVSPHLDDETIGIGGLLSQLHDRGIEVSVLFMTNGDHNPIGANLEYKVGYPSPELLIQSGEDRQEEGLSAVQQLGIDRHHVAFLGLPDRGLSRLYSPEFDTKSLVASGTLVDHVPYHLAYQRGMSYTGTATRAALTRYLKEQQPTLVITTAEEDAHSDHSASAKFVRDAVAALPAENRPRTAYFLIHHSNYPRPAGTDSSKALLPPRALRSLPWRVVWLDPATLATKKQALSEYKSQLVIPQLGRLMRSMMRQNELLVVRGEGW